MERVNTRTGVTVGREGVMPAYETERRIIPGAETPGEQSLSHDQTVVAVIPAYNEDRFIGSVLLKIRPYVDRVIVVDDGSSDKTAAIAREAGADVLEHCINQGKARAMSTGFARALALGADVVVTIDADGQHDPHEIPQVVAPVIQGHADMVIGSRFRGTRSQIPLWRQFGQHGLTLVTNVASGVASSDSQSGFRAFRADALRSLEIHGDGFSIESELQFWAHEHDLRVVEAPISVVYAEKAKRNPVHQALQVLNGIFGLVSQARPLLFFGASGLLVALLGIAFWYRVVQIYDLSHELDLTSIIVATLLIVIGVLATFQGITLHTMRHIMVAQAQRMEAPASTRDEQGNCSGTQSEMAQDMHRA